MASTYDNYKNELMMMKQEDDIREYGRNYIHTKEERQLDERMDFLRSELIGDKYVYATRDGAESTEPRAYPPIRPFYEVRDEIEKNPLIETFRRMPKGANLHIHTSATLKADDFIDLLKEFDNRYGTKDYRIMVKTENNQNDNILTFTPMFLKGRWSGEKFICPEGFTCLKDFGEDQEKTLRSMLTMTDNRIGEVKYIWDEFNNIFSRVKYIMKVRTFYKMYYRKAFEKMIDDNISHVELRFGVSFLQENNDKDLESEIQESEYDYDDFPDSVYESVIEIYAVYEEAKKYAENKGGKAFTLKLIVSASRKKTTTKAPEDSVRRDLDMIDDLNENLQVFRPEDVPFIVGYDLVSEEDRGWDTDEIVKGLFMENGESRNIPFFFHDGESCWANDTNLFSAIALNTTRIGHGINLYHFPDLVEAVKDKSITLEVCPISNQLLRYTQDLRTHPIAEYMKRGIDCVICNDDPQIFNYNGLAYDFWEIYFSQLIGLGGIKKLVFNSIDKSMLSDEMKAKQRKNLEVQWNDFVAKEIELLKA